MSKFPTDLDVQLGKEAIMVRWLSALILFSIAFGTAQAGPFYGNIEGAFPNGGASQPNGGALLQFSNPEGKLLFESTGSFYTEASTPFLVGSFRFNNYLEESEAGTTTFRTTLNFTNFEGSPVSASFDFALDISVDPETRAATIKLDGTSSDTFLMPDGQEYTLNLHGFSDSWSDYQLGLNDSLTAEWCGMDQAYVFGELTPVDPTVPGVPEPTSLAMAGFGFGALACRIRRKKN